MTEPTANATSASQSPESVHEMVREAYDRVARGTSSGCCGPSGSSCGAGPNKRDAYAENLGYSPDDRDAAPDDANLGLGCGNPTALAELSPGETVVDLGAGAGFDAFIAAQRVGAEGRVIGVDMTPGMLERSRRLAVERGVAGYVEFREGYVEDLPVASGTVDVVISNCVINLVPDKEQAFREAYRVLKSGGRLAVSDILLSAPLLPESRAAAELYVGCVAGALVADEYLAAVKAAGFVDVAYTRTPAGFTVEEAPDELVRASLASVDPAVVRAELDKVWSYSIRASKP